MPRALFIGTTIVAAFQLHLAAAASPVEDAPITAPVAALAAQLEIDPLRVGHGFVAELARLLYTTPDSRPPTLAGPRGSGDASAASRSALTVPVPLSAAVWSRAIFRRNVRRDELVAAILSDRRAALLCRGLAALDDGTLTYLAERPALLTFLYERAAAVFAAFGDNLRIQDGRVIAPGGEMAAPLWETAVAAPLAEPDRFVRVLFGELEGRLAYLYDVVSSASPAAQRFVLGAWLADAEVRRERFKALADACVTSYYEWHATDAPFARPLADLAVLLMRIRLEPSGRPTALASPSVWADVFDAGVMPSASAQNPAAPAVPDVVDAAWLVGATGNADMYTRLDRLDQFGFGQRVFPDAVADAETIDVLKAFRRQRMLLLTLERMGIHAVDVYAAAVQRAEALDQADDDSRFWTLAQFQGALAIVSRMRRGGAIDRAASESLVRSLSSVPLDDGRYAGGIAAWIAVHLTPVLPPGSTIESRLLNALAGAALPTVPRIDWEGQRYRLDLPLAERRRLEIVRRKQGGPTLDLALGLDAVARSLAGSAGRADRAQAAAAALRQIAEESGFRLRTPAVNLLPPGVRARRDGLNWVHGAADDLERSVRTADFRRVARTAASLHRLADIVLGDALLSLAYAADIGDPDGAALLAGNVALRHDFGLAKMGSVRTRTPWLMPRQDFRPGVPWHVTGSLLGLDIALAPLSLRRLTIDRVSDAPKLSSIERDGLAVGVMLLDPSRMTDEDRDQLARAVAVGRTRVEQLLAGTETSDSIADALDMDGWRRRRLSWSLVNDPGSVGGQFSLVDLLALGGGATVSDPDAWGAPALYAEGCACTWLPTVRAWRALEGRTQQPMIATTMADVTLAIAFRLREMDLPSALLRPVLTVAMQEFIDRLRLWHAFDWQGLSRQAQQITRESIEDYVSAVTGVNGALVPDDAGAKGEEGR